MQTTPPKKMLTMNILDILRRFTDENHRLTQKQIGELLEQHYNMKADRKSIKRNLTNLIEAGYEIEYSEKTRTAKDGEEEIVSTDWFIRRDFEDSELRLMIDCLLFSMHIPSKQRDTLIEKLKGLSSVYFKAKVKHVTSLPEVSTTNKQLFYTVDVLDEAISNGLQVAYKYCDYGIDKKLHYRHNAQGEVRIYQMSPYQMVATNGHYYLICAKDGHDSLSNYRIDRITDITLTDLPIRPLKELEGMQHGLDLPQHMAEHVYMFSGGSVRVKFRTLLGNVGAVMDWFGDDVSFENATEKTVDVTLRVNEQAMLYWALQYGQSVQILEPASLRNKVRETLLEVAEKYK